MTTGLAVAITTVCFTALALVAVFMRLIARLALLKNGGRDEIAIVISALSSVGLLVSTLYQVKYGLGRHFTTLSAEDFERVLKGLWISILFYVISLSFTKTSILLQYMRVFIGSRIRPAIWILLFIVVALFIQGILTGIFACVPIDGFWTLGKPARCINKEFIWFFSASFNILTDILIISLPMPVLSKLNLPIRQKIGLMMIFGLGAFICLVSILRLHALHTVSISTDITLDNAGASLWSNLEVNVGIICASLPTTKPLISRLFPRLLSSSHSNAYLPTNQASSVRTPKFFSSKSQNRYKLRDLEMNDVKKGKMVTKVEAGEHVEGDIGLALGDRDMKWHDNGRDIFVCTSMTQDVERKMGNENGSADALGLPLGRLSEGGSEKDLISRYRSKEL